MRNHCRTSVLGHGQCPPVSIRPDMPAVRSCLQVTAVIEYMRESCLTDERQTPAFAVTFLDANKDLVCDIVGIESVDAMTHSYSESILEERNKRGLGVGTRSRCIMAGFQEGDLKTHEHYASALLELIGNYPLLAEYTKQYHIIFPADFPGQHQDSFPFLVRCTCLSTCARPCSRSITPFSPCPMYLGATGKKLPESPSTYRIDLVIASLARAWCIIRNNVLALVKQAGLNIKKRPDLHYLLFVFG
ncbi:hypothetical protein BCR44DRAFT_279286 [Catenaria anguillulae PL171]|uniref:Uncharacterized protein n=1 Tax=Catenaria anguillulae PL171 TaxID=765915 RepID=A0A1Y2HN25_9FUNG|nr:hypothetical protein BCR44DRAFT_279286 [Catenaria anguillulae PL171]